MIPSISITMPPINTMEDISELKPITTFGSYFAVKRFIVDEMLRYTNPYPYVIGLVLRTTKNITNVDVKHRERQVGTSGYTIGKLLALWFNGFTAFSIKPLRVATAIGAFSAIAGFLYGIYTIVKKLVNPNVNSFGFPSITLVIHSLT